MLYHQKHEELPYFPFHLVEDRYPGPIYPLLCFLGEYCFRYTTIHFLLFNIQHRDHHKLQAMVNAMLPNVLECNPIT